MSDERYVVTGHMAAFDTVTQDGIKRITFFRGQPVPQDATAAAIKHHLSVNLIAKVPGSGEFGVDSAGAAVVGDERPGDNGSEPGEPFGTANTVTEDQGKDVTVLDTERRPTSHADTDVEAKRAAAKAKLPADGSLPDGRAAKDVWVEFLVGRGYAYDELVKQDPAELKALAKNA